MKKIFFYSTILLSCSMLTSCGPSAEDKYRAEILFRDEADSVLRSTPLCNLDEVLDSTESYTLANKASVKQPTSKTTVIYYANDYNLPPGTIVDFSPNSDWIAGNSENGVCTEQIYIHIRDEHNKVKTYPVDYKTWLVLNADPQSQIVLE